MGKFGLFGHRANLLGHVAALMANQTGGFTAKSGKSMGRKANLSQATLGQLGRLLLWDVLDNVR
jgi:hypothetical protein